VILDSSAIIAIIRRELDRETFLDALLDAKNVAISASTLLEVRIVAQRSGIEGLEGQIIDLIRDHSVEIIAFSDAQQTLAADAHRTYGKGSGHPAKLNFGDCFAYALAKESGEPLLFKGNDFAQTDVKSAFD
jgi:ribonuclease VapC